MIESNNRHLDSLHNVLASYMEMGTGLAMPRFESPPPVVRQGATYNHVTIDRSVVGAVNNGAVESLEVALSNVSNCGQPDFASAIKGFTEVVLSDASLTDGEKEDVLQQVEFLSTESQRSERNESVMKLVLGGLRATSSTVSGITEAWLGVEAVLKSMGIT